MLETGLVRPTAQPVTTVVPADTGRSESSFPTTLRPRSRPAARINLIRATGGASRHKLRRKPETRDLSRGTPQLIGSSDRFQYRPPGSWGVVRPYGNRLPILSRSHSAHCGGRAA
jgi:hypothetical protein